MQSKRHMNEYYCQVNWGGTPLEPSGVVGNYCVSSHESRIYVCVGMAQDLLGGTYTFHRNNTMITIAIACP